jgi:hypothetical protein
MWKIFDLVPGIVWAVVCASLLLLSGVTYVRMVHAQGEVSKLQVKIERTNAANAIALQKLERVAREREQQLQTQVERITNESNEKAKVLSRRVADGDAAVLRLRNDLKRLADARPAPTDSGSAVVAREASTVGELLGACATEYRNVAQSADELRDQVTGLHDYIKNTCTTSCH